jgi:hypothetical protein
MESTSECSRCVLTNKSANRRSGPPTDLSFLGWLRLERGVTFRSRSISTYQGFNPLIGQVHPCGLYTAQLRKIGKNLRQRIIVKCLPDSQRFPIARSALQSISD